MTDQQQQQPTPCPDCAELLGDAHLLRNRVEAMRPVVEAAERWRNSQPDGWQTVTAALVAAVDAYRKAQP